MLKKTKIALALAVVAATPGTAYAGNGNADTPQCRFDLHGGGWVLISCLAGKWK